MADRADLQAALSSVVLKGKTMHYASQAGNMFAFLDLDGRICLRLSEADRATFATRYDGVAVIQHGAVIKGYVALPADLPVAHARLWGAPTIVHAASLKPKPPRRA